MLTKKEKKTDWKYKQEAENYFCIISLLLERKKMTGNKKTGYKKRIDWKSFLWLMHYHRKCGNLESFDKYTRALDFLKV